MTLHLPRGLLSLGFSLAVATAGLIAVPSGPLAAQSRDAACRLVLASPSLPADGTDGFLRLQRVLATALDRASPRLEDRRRGPTSEAALVDLCLAVPFPEGTGDAPETLQLILEYTRLSDFVPDWGARLWAPALAARLAAGSDPGLAARLAGAPAMTGAVLDPDAPRAACGPVALSDQVRAGLAALSAADPRIGRAPDALAQVCAFYPTLEADGVLTETLARYATLEAARPGAVAALFDPAFGPWLAEDAQPRLRRLVGSPPAVQRLIEDFLASRPAPPAPVVDLPQSCRADPRALRYSAFGPTEAALLAGGEDLAPALRALSDLRDTEAALLGDILGVLGGAGGAAGVNACLRDRVAALVAAEDSPARVYQLDETGVAGLAFVADFADSQPVAEALVGRLAPTRDQLLDGTRAAIRRTIAARYDAQIEQAAQVFAASAEPMPPTIDLPAVGIPEADPVELPPSFIVTEITDATLQASIDNPAFVEALMRTQFAPALSREVLAGEVRRVLRPIAEAAVARIVDADAERIAALVQERWAMTPALADAILAIPDLSAAHDLPPEAARQLLGLAYPDRRLMGQAFAAISPPLPVALQDRAVALADQIVPDPDAPRQSGSIAKPDCGCVLRRMDNARVYAFYPFWLAPPELQPDPGAIAPEADAGVAPQSGLPTVDFELVERIAFYGLHWTDVASPGVLDLRFRQHWLAMRRDFVTSAHRHRTRADLAIRITGWEDWSEAQIETVVDVTDEMMEPFARFDRLTWEEAARFLPTLFDRPQPDALTLIVDGYDGVGRNADAARLVALVERIARPLAARGQSVHLAFDLKLADQSLDDPILDDIRPLLERGPGGVATVDNILVFLERPTADTARQIRFRMESGPFRADVRTEILRRILPVVPPGGHEGVAARTPTGPLGDAEPYGQLIDDVVYFRDNFGGIGFWPTPLADDPDHIEAANIVFDRWDLWRFPSQLANFELRFDSVCAFACPNRFYLSAAAMVLGASLAGLIWWSFYSGTADRVAFRLGGVWVGTAGLLVLLMLLTSCDQFAVWPPVFLAALVLLLLTVLVFATYQRARNGPRP